MNNTSNINSWSVLNWALCLLIFTWISFTANAQDGNPKAKDLHGKAIKAYQGRQWDEAEKYALKAIEADPQWAEPYIFLGDIYHGEGKYDQEASTLKKLLEIQPDNMGAFVNLGALYFVLHKYDESEEAFKKVLASNAPDKFKAIAARKIPQIQFIREMMAHPVPFKPENLGDKINSREDEYFPAFTVDGENMYFTRKKIVDSFIIPGTKRYTYQINEDLMWSRKLGAGWSKATDIPGDINTQDNEGAISIAPDGSYLVFTACDRKTGLGSCDLYISFLVNGEWTKPVNMGGPVNTPNKETQPSITYDGRSIIFASNRPGGFGGLDLYMSTRDDNWNFSEPVNLGKVINTSGEEQSPFIHPDNKTLYFCSTGHLGMGKNDIFISRKNSNGDWDSAKNVGYPINTPDDEPGLMVDREGRYAYFSSSNQGGGYGLLDIYRFPLPKELKPELVIYLKGKVFDNETKAVLNANLELVELETGKTVISKPTDNNGILLVALPGGHDYMVNVSAPGYLFYSENIPLKDYKKAEPYTHDFPLEKIHKGGKITLNNIFFSTDQHTLKPESISELQRLAAFLKANSNLKLEISGHTDNTGGVEHNKELSENRAKSVYNYLIQKGGIPASRLTFKGYGDTMPVAPNTTEEGKAKNRRTEVKVIE